MPARSTHLPARLGAGIAIPLPVRARDRFLVAVLLACGLGLAGAFVLTLLSGAVPPQKTDFITYYSASRMVLDGSGSRLYDFAALARIERGVVPPYALTYGVLPYVYPPYFAIATAPLAATGLAAAYYSWAALNLGFLSVALLKVQRRSRLSLPASLALWLGALTFIPTFIALLHGQVSFLLLALLGGALLCLERRWDVAAGCLLAVAMLKPTYVLPCLVVLVVLMRWRAVLAFLGSAVVLFLAPMPLLGAGINRSYVDTLLRATGWTSQFGYGSDKTASLAGPLRLILPAHIATVVEAAAALALLGALALYARRERRIAPVFGLAVLLGLLMSPHVLVHDLVLLLLPIGAALECRGEGHNWLALALGAVYCLAILGLVLAPVVHLQLIILAMVALAAWFFTAPSRRVEISSGP